MNESIPNSLLPHLNEIAVRLWSGHAAIMVGAGFSRNATPVNDSCVGFPDWNQLGDLFYEKTRGEKIKDGRFLNVLKLADEVQASFGRPMLHQLLRASIPDTDYEPSDLHRDLLNLPWSDVFTTNYDTLLERAAPSLTERNYQLVVNNQNLIYSEKPRIIKLHGSFPSVEPFIITEEDYRRYPNDFAPFVNTVQQSLLENTLCLVGFSGDDPNFLRWIGWIRDNLGEEQSPKIYLIGVLNLTVAQKSLLVRYNIVSIDMSDLDGVGQQDHFKGMQKFFEFCAGKKSESNRLDWPRFSAHMHPDRNGNKTIIQAIEEVLPIWKAQRECFPGWVVVPEDRRETLWMYTKNWEGVVKEVHELTVSLLLDFLFEFFWRLEKCLCPIFDKNAKLIEFILNYGEEYIRNLEPTSSDYVDEFEPLELGLNHGKEKFCFLQLTYLRYLREEGKSDDWNFNVKRATAFLSLDIDYSRYNYEKCLYSLFEFDIEKLESRLQHWTVKPSQPFWIAKRAGLLAEIGKVDEAIPMLENALKIVRARLNLRPVTSDYSDVSQEAYILVLLKYVKESSASAVRDFKVTSEFSDRWNILKRYKCDPWNELKLLEYSLNREYNEPAKSENMPLFDLGRSSSTIYIGSRGAGYLDAFKLLKFVEEIGIPFKVPGGAFAKESAISAIARLTSSAPYWSACTMLRIGDSKAVDKIFSRKSMVAMKGAEADSMAKKYCLLFEKIVFSDNFRDAAQSDLLKKVVPELLSRLLSKCSSEGKKSIFNLLERIYKSEDKNSYSGIDKLAMRLIASFSWNEAFDYFSALIQFPVMSSDNLFIEFPNPFNFSGKINKNTSQISSDYSFDSARLDELIHILSEEYPGRRRWALRTLWELKRLGMLDEHQVTAFCNAVWSLTDDQGFPKNTDYFRFALCRDLCPVSIRGDQLIKQYILNEEFQTQAQRSDRGIGMSGGNVPLCNEIIGASDFVEWTADESHLIFTKLLGWWDLDKKFLNIYPSGDVRREFELRFAQLRFALIASVPRNFNAEQKREILALQQMVHEMEDYGLPVCSVKCSFAHVVPNWNINLIAEISTCYLDARKVFIENALQGMYCLLKKDNENFDNVIEHYLNLLSSSLLLRDKNRILYSLVSALNITSKYKKYFRKYFEEAVLIALDKLRSETDGSQDLFEVHDALHIREFSAQLAYSLFKYYQDLKLNVPEVILEWRAICKDPDEFVEIRNAWVLP